jgi:hypothetical protein
LHPPSRGTRFVLVIRHLTSMTQSLAYRQLLCITSKALADGKLPRGRPAAAQGGSS